MALSSINIQPVKGGSEVHNKRLKELSYVRKDLPHEYWECDTQSNRLADIKARYTATTGQQLQKKATPIREGVVLIDPKTSMQDLQNLAKALESRFGVKCFQIAIHCDEGHWEGKEWKSNLHAHMVFDWSQKDGTSIKLNKRAMVEMQTLVAESLGMERGVSSDIKHLNSVQYKLKTTLEKLAKAKEVIAKANDYVAKANAAIYAFAASFKPPINVLFTLSSRALRRASNCLRSV